jgi:hypothetical protein
MSAVSRVVGLLIQDSGCWFCLPLAGLAALSDGYLQYCDTGRECLLGNETNAFLLF